MHAVCLERSGTTIGKPEKSERKRKISLRETEEITKKESAMSDAILEELKSLRSDLTQQMQKKLVMSLQHFKAPLTPGLRKLKALFQRLMKFTTENQNYRSLKNKWVT